jgi:translation initiation factor 1
MGKGKIVYSTDPDWQEICPDCNNPIGKCACESKKIPTGVSNTVYIKREVKGRKGKTVTTISNIGENAKNIQKELQRLCGAGGTIKQGIIEIQGDHREKIRAHLQKNEYTVKISGG